MSSLTKSIRKAIDFCIRNGILTEFLKQHREEALHMILEEYNEELHKRTEKEYWMGIGREDGLERGREILKLHAQGKQPEAIAELCNVPLEAVNRLLDALSVF